MKKILSILGIIFLLGLVTAAIYTEPWNTNQRGNNHNLTDMGVIEAITLESTEIFVGNVYGSNSWCAQEFANTSTACGGLSTGLYNSTGNWTNITNAYDGNWSTFAEINDTNGTIAYFLINYTKPSNALSASQWQIKRAIAINNYSIDSVCWSQSNTLIFRGVVQNLSSSNTTNFWQCYNGTSYVNVTAAQDGSKLYEESMNWRLSSEASLNATLDWDKLQNYPSACPGSSAITQVNDSIICSDLWVDIAGDTMNGNLTLNGSNIYFNSTSHYLQFNGSCIVAVGTSQTGGCL